MSHILLRLHAELNDFLPIEQRHKVTSHPLNDSAAVKHLIESAGVPHPEVGLILVNDRAVDFGHLLKPRDCVDVYPATHFTPNAPLVHLRPPLRPPIRFVLDTHLGQLARYLRLFGFDALYCNDYDDPTLAQISSRYDRVLLTRDRGLLKRKIVVYGHCVRAADPRQQIIAILRRYDLVDYIHGWHRCLHCNGLLQTVSKESIIDRLEPKTRRFYNEFHLCQTCSKIYWKGSHYVDMQAFMQDILAEL